MLDGNVIARNNEICNVDTAILVWSKEVKTLESYIQKVDGYVANQKLLNNNLGESEDYTKMVVGSLETYTFTVNWNDNDNSNRPDLDITLYYKTGNNEPSVLDEDVLISWGMDETSIQTLLASIESVNENTDINNPNKKAYNNWVYTFSLPKELVSTEELEEGETPETKAITYSFKIKNQSELEEEYFVVYKDGKTVVNTLKAVMEFNVAWKDSSNKYDTRISDILDDMVLYRKSTKSSSSAEENLGNSYLRIDDNKTKITTDELAKYDSEGYPYEYYIKLQNNVTSVDISVNNKLTDANGVIYNITYTNIGNDTENTTACYADGTMTYTLNGEVPLNITKEWLDDNKDTTITERPKGVLYLYRYANISGMDYTKGSPVAGMQVALDTTPANKATSYEITFTQDYFPRFDEDGNEYVYYIQEILDSNEKYEKVFTYTNPTDNKDKDVKSVVFNGGTLQNRRREAVSISATKDWKAQAIQDMTASVKLELQRRLVDDENAEFGKVITEDLDGFRAEEMSKTYVFGGLPQFNEMGLRYEYRVIETEVTINGSTVPISQNNWSEETIKIIDGRKYTSAEQTCKIAGKTFVLTYLVDELGNTTLTNSLKGKTEVWVKKIWTDNKVPSDSKDSTVDISVYNKTTSTLVATGQITVDEAGSFVRIAEELPQYDAEGREIPYYITENTVSGYYNSIGYETKNGVSEDGQQVNRVEATVTNTLATGGRSVEIRKEWYDDSDENCRGDVEVALYHTSDNGVTWEYVASTTLTKARDWKGWISLSWENEDKVRDEKYENYYVKETGIIRSVDGEKETYKSDYASLETYPDLDITPELISEVKTNMHYYDIKASVNSAGSVYTFQNVRKGLVDISLNKVWNDGKYQEDIAPQQVTFNVMRSTTYGTNKEIIESVILGGKTDEVKTVAWTTKLENLPKYDSDGILYKYWIEESIIEELDLTGKVIAKHELDGDTSYVLSGNDNQRYTINISTVAIYGEHNGETEPMADNLSVTATNTREETIDFVVNKVWKDVTRAGDSRIRPDIYLTIYEQIGDAEPKDITKSVERVWNTSDDYHWICTFKDIPRYTSGGIEITYTVKENMPVVGEYKTVYYADEPIVVDSEEELSFILKNKNYYDVPEGATVLDGYVTNGGTIVNYRDGYRYLTGSKIWLNVPNNMASSNYPSITLTLEKEVFVSNNGEGESGYVPVKVTYDSDDVFIDLKNGQKVFTFGYDENSIKLDKYDAYGTLIHYSVEETSEPILGYREPVYNPEKLMVTNACKSPDELEDSERAYVDVEKIWDMTDANVVDKLEPVITLELWRVMTDGSGNILDDTAESVGKSATVKYNSGNQKVSFGKATEDTVEGDITKIEGKLAKYGYNGEIFYYYVREKVNGQYITENVKAEGYTGISAYNITTPYCGYRVAITANDRVLDLNNETANYFDYEITNHYTGENYITLSGTKYWTGDSDNVFNTRPENITLNIYRQIDGDSTTLENITDKVDITWNKTNINDWTYEVKVKSPCNDITLGKVGGTATLSGYGTNGKKYIYYVEEVISDKDNYNAEVVVGTLVNGIGAEGNLTIQGVQSSNGNITASFRNRMEYTDYTVNKIWKKQVSGLTSKLTSEELDMMLPENITITIEYLNGAKWEPFKYINGDNAGNIASKTISKSECKKLISNGEMSILFKELPKFNETEEEIIYRAVESQIDGIGVVSNRAAGFNVDVVQESDGVTTTITNTLETIPLKITKKWDDNNNQDGLRPAELEFSIIRDGDETSPISITLNSTNKNQDEVETWESEVVYVPKYQTNGVDLSVYTVRENLDDEDKTHYILEDPISVEDSYAMEDPSPTVVATPSSPKTFAFVNMHGERLIDISVTKVVSDSSIETTIGDTNQDDIRPTTIEVALQRRVDKNSSWINIKYDQVNSTWLETDEEDWQTIDLTGESSTWNYTWENLIARWNTDGTNLGMKYYEYQVIEKDIDAYSPTYKDSNSSVDASKTPVVITEQNCRINGDVNEGNILLTNVLDTTTLYVEKSWVDKSSYFADKPEVQVQLQYRLESSDTWLDGSVAVKALNTANSWKTNFANLPVENSEGTKYEYYIREATIGGTAYNSSVYQYSYSGSEAENTTKDSKTTSTITNTLEVRKAITVTKEWDDDNNRDGIRPDSITINLIKDKGTTNSKTQTVTLSSGNSWSYTFDKLPKYRPDGTTLCTYTVEEVITDATANSAYTISYSVDGEDYELDSPTITETVENPDTDIREVIVKNTYTPKTMNIVATKVWEDYNDLYGTRLDSVILLLKSTTNEDGITGSTIVTGINNPITVAAYDNIDDNWKYSWNDLPIKDNSTGTKLLAGESQIIYYSVVEVKADGTEVVKPLNQYQSPTYDYTVEGTGGVKLKDGAEVSVYGNINDANGSQHNVTVTNTLDTVKVTVMKQWNDYENIYGSRPDSITFTLQQKVDGSNVGYQDAADNQGNILTEKLLCGASTSDTQKIEFLGLPKYNAEGELYEYRALETSYEDEDGIAQVTANVNDITLGNFETRGFEYSYEMAVDGNTTTIENTLELERITISGEKSWEDYSNKYGSRPKNVSLTIYYKENISDLNWKTWDIPYTITWDKTTKADIWTYSIEGLVKYVTGTRDTIIYCVVEGDSSFYEQTLPVKNASNLNGNVINVDQTDKSVSGVNFTNTLTANEELVVSKSVDRGCVGDIFEFKVWVSDIPIDDNNQGVLYTGDYEIYGIDDDIDNVTVESKNTTTGNISIKAGEKFLIKRLPNNYYYMIEEVKQEDYELITPYDEKSGQLDTNISEVDLLNHGYTKLAIGNDTTNQDSDNNTVHMGGKVVVITDLSTTPSQSEEDGYVNDEVAVAWTPNLYWTLGNTFTIEYTRFDGVDGRITISDYIDSDGNIKPLSECTVVEDTLGELDKFIETGASLSWYNNGTAVKLVIVEDELDMPYRTRVTVKFVPTLAVCNVTPNGVGGIVSVENGSANVISDGVHGNGNIIYPGATTVYGVAGEEYQISTQQLAVRNMNDNEGSSVLLNVDADGRFLAVLPTVLDGNIVNIQLSGHVEYITEDGAITQVRITLDELPIPIQFDILFSEIEQIPDEPTTEEPEGSTESTNTSDENNTSETVDEVKSKDSQNSNSVSTADNAPIIGISIIAILSIFMYMFLKKRRKYI